MSNDTIPKYSQIQYQTDECKHLLPSLPVENGWASGITFHLYQGFWHPTFQIQRVLSAQLHFRALDSDIFLATQPKSGTTWLKATIFALLNRTRFTKLGICHKYSNHPLLFKNPHDLVPFLEFDLYMEEENPDLSSYASPRILATHMPFTSLPETIKDSNCKIVYLCRNPKDTFVSLWHFLCKLGGTVQLDDSFDRFCKGVSACGPYWDHVMGYYKASLEMPHKFLFMRYEDMMETPIEQLMKLADFLCYPFSKEEEVDGSVDEILRLCSFDNLRMLEVNRTGKTFTELENNTFFRKGEVGDWVNYLTPEMVKRIDRITEDKFGPLGLKI